MEKLDITFSWEIQENRRLSEISSCKIVDQSHSDSENGRPPSPEEADYSKPALRLRAFLHPELTKSSFCEAHLYLAPHHSLCFAGLALLSNAPSLEACDPGGEHIAWAKGVRQRQTKDGEDWFRIALPLQQEFFSLSLKMMLPSDERILLIRSLEVALRPFSWTEHQLRASTIDPNNKVPAPDQVAAAAATTAIASAALHCGESDSAASGERALDGESLRSWLEARLLLFETNVMGRLNEVDEKLTRLERLLASP